MSRFVGLMVVGLGLFGAANAMAFSTARPTAAQQKKISASLIAAAKRSAAFKTLAKSGDKPVVKVSYRDGSNIPGFIGNGLLDANVTIYTKGTMLPGTKPRLIGQDERTYNIDYTGKGFKAVADGAWGHLYQTAQQPVGVDVKRPSNKLMNQLTGTPAAAVGGATKHPGKKLFNQLTATPPTVG